MSDDRVAPLMVRERERKFDLDSGRPVPGLDDTGPVAAQRGPERVVLDAAYFDTDDHRLLRHGITLRRRTGGADAGWHLKLPAGSGVRDEVQLPLDAGDGTVPGELADRVQAETGGRDLVEIAHLRTERYNYDLTNQAGGRLAVLSDDHVSAEMAGRVLRLDGWRELEVELEPSADPDLLDVLGDALTRAGARPAHWPSKLRRLLAGVLPDETEIGSTAGDVVMAYVRAQVEAVRRQDLAVRGDEDDAVHKLRVAMRRLRSTLSSFRRVLDRSRTKAISDELRWAGLVLSDARSTEVMRGLFADELSTLDADVTAARLALNRHFDRAAADARAAILDTLNGQRYATLLGSLEALIADPPFTAHADEPARTELRHALRRAHRRLAEAVEHLDDAEDIDAGLHEARKKAKQARYAADAVAPASGRRVRRWGKAAKGIQATLGDYHDLVEVRALLYQLRRQGTVSSQAAFVFGILHERATTHGTALHERFTRQWREFERLG
ncbi:CYTH and CHAD domain-containing protein [Amycolatopsis sp. GM8]|uniref:CYTH and CHAD domain-containing protein n=1 Tax=Amycolatopsis sp. GM8 TaxID=2896530 RepID=UPI001F44CEFD|nr:CYTH and CHAD domain-containing protein [Amycolatopsis sp. GM8]